VSQGTGATPTTQKKPFGVAQASDTGLLAGGMNGAEMDPPPPPPAMGDPAAVAAPAKAPTYEDVMADEAKNNAAAAALAKDKVDNPARYASQVPTTSAAEMAALQAQANGSGPMAEDARARLKDLAYIQAKEPTAAMLSQNPVQQLTSDNRSLVATDATKAGWTPPWVAENNARLAAEAKVKADALAAAGNPDAVAATPTNVTPMATNKATPATSPVSAGLLSGGTNSTDSQPSSPNPYFIDQAKSIMEMSNRNLREGAFQGIRDNSMVNGSFGGDRQGIAEGVAIRGADEATRNTLANLFAGQYDTDQSRQLQKYLQAQQIGATRGMFDISQTNEMERARMGDATSRFGIQTQGASSAAATAAQRAANENQFYSTNRSQDLDQYRLAAMLQQQGQAGTMSGLQGLLDSYATEYQAPWNTLNNYAGLMGTAQGGASHTTTGTQPGRDNTSQYIGMALTAAAMFSDKRLKENIKPVGETFDGVPLYSYNYKGVDLPQIGPMAQEVEKIKPKAMGPNIGGFKTVKYGLLGG
jgi:hypothetical protein